MRIQVTAAVPGAPNLRIGAVIELPPDEARAWLASGVAVEVVEDAPRPRIVINIAAVEAEMARRKARGDESA